MQIMQYFFFLKFENPFLQYFVYIYLIFNICMYVKYTNMSNIYVCFQ